jgi:ABC-type antimicrobial peptide transport system permease subunit
MELKKLQIKPSIKLRGGVTKATGKLGLLQARLVRTSLVFGGIALGAIVLAAMLNRYYGNQQMQFATLNAQINDINRQKQEMESKFEKAKSSIDLYEVIVNGSSTIDLSINPKKAQQLLTKLKEGYGLNELRLEMSGITAMGHQEYKTQSTDVIASEVTLSFTGVTDEDLFAFINGVMTGFTGYVRVLELQLERLQPIPIPKTVWADIAAGKVPEMVRGRVKFRWLGIQNKPEVLLKNAGTQP